MAGRSSKKILKALRKKLDDKLNIILSKDITYKENKDNLYSLRIKKEW